MSVVDAVARALPGFGDLKDSVQAATALALAAELDDESNSATSKSMCARALSETMAELRALRPPERKSDGIDEINAKREERRAAARRAASADSSRT